MARPKKGGSAVLNRFPAYAALAQERAQVVARLKLLEEKLDAMKCLSKAATPLPLRRVIEIVMKDEALTASEVYERVIKFGVQFRSPNGTGTVRSILSRYFKYAEGKYSR